MTHVREVAARGKRSSTQTSWQATALRSMGLGSEYSEGLGFRGFRVQGLRIWALSPLWHLAHGYAQRAGCPEGCEALEHLRIT